jgi:hypothetical protein
MLRSISSESLVTSIAQRCSCSTSAGDGFFKKTNVIVCPRAFVILRIPVKPGHHSGGCRATVPVHAGPVSEAV